MTHYQPSSFVWTGRKSPNADQYYHEQVQKIHWNKYTAKDRGRHVVILGYACQQGVMLNQGRVGAADGPKHIRQYLSTMPFHHQTLDAVYDMGDFIYPINSEGLDLESFQSETAVAISDILNHGGLSVLLGGGHDMAYAHFRGIQASEKGKNMRIGLINIDAHFDLRPLLDGAHSGTPYSQIHRDCVRFGKAFDYLTIGIQQQSNTPDLFIRARETGTKYILNDDCIPEKWSAIRLLLQDFIQRVDAIYLSIDLDAIDAAFSPGVSAPSSFGLQPMFLRQVLHEIKAYQKLVAVDVAECNPLYDIDGRTGRLAAKLVDILL